jgi:uncharacterized protein YjbI with pentapeptide repeats
MRAQAISYLGDSVADKKDLSWSKLKTDAWKQGRIGIAGCRVSIRQQADDAKRRGSKVMTSRNDDTFKSVTNSISFGFGIASQVLSSIFSSPKEHSTVIRVGHRMFELKRGVDLSGLNLDEVAIPNAQIPEAKMRGASFARANLENADLTGADMSSCTMEGANLRDANLSDAKLTGANLSGADMSGAKLKRVHGKNANLKNAILRGADLDAADLRGADIAGAEVEPEILSQAIIDEG